MYLLLPSLRQHPRLTIFLYTAVVPSLFHVVSAMWIGPLANIFKVMTEIDLRGRSAELATVILTILWSTLAKIIMVKLVEGEEAGTCSIHGKWGSKAQSRALTIAGAVLPHLTSPESTYVSMIMKAILGGTVSLKGFEGRCGLDVDIVWAFGCCCVVVCVLERVVNRFFKRRDGGGGGARRGNRAGHAERERMRAERRMRINQQAARQPQAARRVVGGGGGGGHEHQE